MAELINTFSWSCSAAEDFEECRRKRYWAKYAMWNGWKSTATPLQKAAYRLSKMDNRFSLLGYAVEEAVMWIIRQQQAGQAVTAEQAYETVARPLLNRSWKESRERQWAVEPKKFCCLREHYYDALDAETQKQCVAYIMEQTKRCLGNFIAGVLPKLAAVKPAQEVAIAKAGLGDPESFALEGRSPNVS